MAAINFYNQGIDFKVPYPRKTSSWLQVCIKRERKRLLQINYIFCSDEELLAVNQEYLNHQTFTDIITFDNSDGPGLEGDIFISVERVKENASKFNVHFDEELRRVMIHGVLHLCGYKDKTKSEKDVMRQKEDRFLSLYH